MCILIKCMNITNNFPLTYITTKNVSVTGFKNNKPTFGSELKADVFEKTSPKMIETKDGTIFYDKEGNFSHIEFKEAQPLDKTLNIIQRLQDKYKLQSYGLVTSKYIFSEFDKAFSEKFKDMKFTKYLGCGNTAMALENEEGKVLKLSELNQFAFNRKTEKFDAPIYARGKIEPCYYYYVQEKCSRDDYRQRRQNLPDRP